MKKTVKIYLMGESHIDPTSIYCLRKFIAQLLRAKIPVKLAGEFECDKSLLEMKEWFTRVTTLNKTLLSDPLLKPFVKIKGQRQYFQNTDAAKYALSVAYKKPGDSKVMHEFSLYLLQQERMLEALRLFEIIEKQKIQFIGIDRPKAITEEMIRKHGKTDAVAFDKKIQEEREKHMLTQIMHSCVEPLLIDLNKSTNENALGVICVYLGPTHVNAVMERIKQISFSEDVSIEVIPCAVFSDTVLDEVQRNRSTLGLSLPDQLIQVNESSEGIFDIRACFEFLQLHLPEVSFPHRITKDNQFAEGLKTLLPWAEITTQYFLDPDDDRGDITNYTVDVSIKTTNLHQQKYLTQFFKPIVQHVSNDPAKSMVTVKDVNVHPKEMQQFIYLRLPNHLDRARNAIRYVKWSCPIGAATHELDKEKTKSFDLSVPWVNTSVALLRNANHAFYKALHDEVDACGIAAEEWTSQMMRLKQIPVPTQANCANPASLMKDLSKIFKDEMQFGKMLFDETLKLYNEHSILMYIIHKTAEHAYERKCGNCGEQAVLAFVYLLKLNVAPIELFQIENGDHCFVVIGRARESDPRIVSSWRNAVICDPWANFYCYAKDITEKQLKELLGEKPSAYPKPFIRQETAIYLDSNRKRADAPVLALTLRDVYRKLVELTLRLHIPNSQAYIQAVGAKADIEDKSAAIFRLNSYNRISYLEAQSHDRELRRIAKEPAKDVHAFFSTITKPPKLNSALQEEIKAFKFQR